MLQELDNTKLNPSIIVLKAGLSETQSQEKCLIFSKEILESDLMEEYHHMQLLIVVRYIPCILTLSLTATGSLALMEHLH